MYSGPLPHPAEPPAPPPDRCLPRPTLPRTASATHGRRRPCAFGRPLARRFLGRFAAETVAVRCPGPTSWSRNSAGLPPTHPALGPPSFVTRKLGVPFRSRHALRQIDEIHAGQGTDSHAAFNIQPASTSTPWIQLRGWIVSRLTAVNTTTIVHGRLQLGLPQTSLRSLRPPPGVPTAS